MMDVADLAWRIATAMLPNGTLLSGNHQIQPLRRSEDEHPAPPRTQAPPELDAASVLHKG